MATGKIIINFFDGTRQPFATRVLLAVTDGNKRTVFRDFVQASTVSIDVPFFDNSGDQYTVLASPDKGLDAGFFPVNVSPTADQQVFLMFLPKEQDAEYNFASWKDLQQHSPRLVELFSQGAGDKDKAQQRYEGLMEDKPRSLACLFNILTACRDIHLPQSTVLDYFRQFVWDSQDFPMLQDRFYVWADPMIVSQVRQANTQPAPTFAEEKNPGLLHKGATTSYKQIALGEANVQLTFHENEPSPAGTKWVLVEPDIDYFRDMTAHFFLEVIPGFFGLTDPNSVYVLRWIAGRQAGMPEFNPPYTIRQGA
jgi:hypothetical protein